MTNEGKIINLSLATAVLIMTIGISAAEKVMKINGKEGPNLHSGEDERGSPDDGIIDFGCLLEAEELTIKGNTPSVDSDVEIYV